MRSVVAGAALLLSATTAAAQPACAVAAGASLAGAVTTPLDAPVSLRLRDVTLRVAIDRAATLAGVPVAYADDRLPLDRRVCLNASGASLGSVLRALLHDVAVEPAMVAGRVVLVPRTGAGVHSAGASMVRLERVVVRDSAGSIARRARTVGMEIIDGAQLRRESRGSLASILDAAVTGAWVWDGGSSSLTARYGGLRGASSFGSSAPQIYIDGIAVANADLSAQFDSDMIERIEVIRGPQGAALHGADAIGGVINVVSRHDVPAFGEPRAELSSMAGAGATAFAPGLIATHTQRFSLRGGSEASSYGLALAFGQDGAVSPQAESGRLHASARVRHVGSVATLAGTARMSRQRVGAGPHPLLGDSLGALAGTAGSPPSQLVSRYTVSGSADFSPQSAWQHTLVAGVDGYALENAADPSTPFLVAADSALRASRSRGDRLTLRATTTNRIGSADDAAAVTISAGLEQLVLREAHSTSLSLAAAIPGRAALPVTASLTGWNSNTGVFSRAAVAWRRRVYLDAGVRVERSSAFTGDESYPVLPQLGVAVVQSVGRAEVKLRSAFGRGIRAPQTPTRTALAVMPGREFRVRGPALGPESQSGLESGAELRVGQSFSVQVTRFDQVASGLIQDVVVGIDSGVAGAGWGARSQHMAQSEPQNVGVIANRGWELRSQLRRGGLTLSAAQTMVDSRVRGVAESYRGDLRAGDRALGIPARTTSLAAAWSESRWFASLAASRASDWMEYDRLSLSRALSRGSALGPHAAMGDNLRAYWLSYDGQTHLRFASSVAVRRGVELLFNAENLLGGQLGEPDNATIRAGRTITAGVRANF